MHREQHVDKCPVATKRVVRHRELESDEHRLDAADHEKHQPVTMYRMPMRLWSTVESHAIFQCSRSLGCQQAGATRVVIDVFRSFQGLEISDELRDLFVREVEVRHQHARL